MQLLLIRKAMPAAIHAKTEPKLKSPRNKKAKHVFSLCCWKKPAAEQAASSLPSWHSATQLPEGGAGPRPTLSPPGRYPSMEVQRGQQEKNNIKETRQKAAWHTSEPL